MGHVHEGQYPPGQMSTMPVAGRGAARPSAEALAALVPWVESHGIAVGFVEDELTSTGRFFGTSIALNRRYDTLTQTFTLAHTFGHCVQWAVDFERCCRLYAAVADARAAGGAALDDAMRDFSRYETEATEYGLTALAATGSVVLAPAFCLFSAADIEAVLIFHRTGASPAWSEFFPAWAQRTVEAGVAFPSFQARPIPAFRPVRVPERNVIRSVEAT